MVKRVFSTESKGVEGEARLRIGKSKVEVLFEGFQDHPYVIDIDECPPCVKGLKSGKKWFISLSGKNDRIFSIRPIEGMCKAKFSHYPTKNGDIPYPKQYDGEYGPYLAFTPILKIVDDEYKGMEVAAFLHYKFSADENGFLQIKGKGKNADLLQEYFEATGLMRYDIKFSDNVLPALQALQLKHPRTFGIGIKNGFVKSYFDLPEEDPDEVEEGENNFDDAPFEEDESESEFSDDTPIEEKEEELDEEGVI